MCEIAHIHPFNECLETQKYDPNNVILLGAHLHKIFDKYLWSINPETCKIELSEKCKNDTSYQINNKTLRVLFRASHSTSFAREKIEDNILVR